MAVFTAEGAAGMTLERVAREIGASKGIILHYFASKEALLTRVLSDVLKVMGKEFRGLAVEDLAPQERLSRQLGFTVNPDLFTQTYARVWLSVVSNAASDHPCRRLRRAISKRLFANLLRGLRPIVGRVEAGAIAESLMALIDGLWLRKALEPASITPGAARALLQTHLEESLAFVNR